MELITEPITVYATIGLAVIVVAAVLINLRQMRMLIQAAEIAKELLVVNTSVTNVQLKDIHKLVNSRLHDALDTIEELKALLLLALSEVISPNDPRVKEALSKKS